MKDINCPCCKKNIISTKNIHDKDNYLNVCGTLAAIFGGPVTTFAGLAAIGSKLYKKHIMNEVDIKCPHCKEKITLTKEQWKEIKKLIKELNTQARHKEQNRL